MAVITEFDIDGFIGQYAYSNRYVKSYLNASGTNPVTCRVCSGGGDFLMAINIKDEFSRHGGVTVDISGFAASAATIIGLGAKHTRISNSSFYLIHPVLDWVDAWGYMNSDKIEELIEELRQTADENKKMTLVLAKAYADKSGKPIADILNLMKEEKWLNADEAKEWGFVDEVYNTTTKMNFSGVAEKFNMMGLPKIPELKRGKDSQAAFIEKIATKIFSGISDLLPHQDDSEDKIKNQNKKTDMKKFEKINGVLKVDMLESTDNKGVYLNEVQLQLLNDAIVGQDEKINTLESLEKTHMTAIEKLDALHPDVKAAVNVEAKVNVIQAKLAAKPGVAPSGQKENKDVTDDGVDWEVMNSLGHMQKGADEIV